MAGADGRRAAGLVLLVVLGVALVAGAALVLAEDRDSAEVPLPHAVAPAAFGEGFLVGERLSGHILAVADPDRPERGELVATLDVVGAPDDQRGLLGLVAVQGDVYAAWTRRGDGRLVVGRVLGPDRADLVWEGPVSADRANGGHLTVHPLTGDLVVGVGDLLDRARVDDPESPHGKLLALDPAQPPDQRPTVLSTGWNNPYASTFLPGARAVVADNAGPRGAERLALAEPRPAVVAELTPVGGDQRAPAALVALPDGDLGLCGYRSRRLERIRWREEPTGLVVDVTDEPVLAATCTTGAAVLADGRVVVTTETGYLVAAPASSAASATPG